MAPDENHTNDTSPVEKGPAEPTGTEAGKPAVKKAPAPVETTFLGYIREWGDALVIAFIVAMFIRMFVVELFKIPSGSMSPTLLGDLVAEGIATDAVGERHEYLLIADPSVTLVQVFRRHAEGHYQYEGRTGRNLLTRSQDVLLQNRLKREEHRILVNKFAYWFSPPDRGDIVIFRVPFRLDPEPYERNGEIIPGTHYERNQSVYVKRAVALGGENLRIGTDGHLYVNDELVTDPDIIYRLQYKTPDRSPMYDVRIPENHVAAFGDNSDNSLDSRYWGPLPEQNLRGKAVLTYAPWKKRKFLNPK